MNTLKRHQRLPAIATIVLVLGLAGCQGPTLATQYLVEPSAWSEGTRPTQGWAMAYIGTAKTKAADSLHLAYSTDGYTWTALYSGKEVFASRLGTGHIRDPYLLRKNDGTFVLLASDFTKSGLSTENGSLYDLYYWNHPSQSIYVAESTDLVTFTGGRLLRLSSEYTVSAPKAYYDGRAKDYAVYWTGTDEQGRKRSYVSHTVDFNTVTNFSSPEVLFDPGYDHSQPVLTKNAGKGYLVFRDDRTSAGAYAGQDLQIAQAETFPGDTFSLASNLYLTRGNDQTTQWDVESPFVVRLANGWGIYGKLANTTGTWKGWTASSLDTAPQSWSALDSSTFSIPSSSTASVVPITADELAVIQAAVH